MNTKKMIRVLLTAALTLALLAGCGGQDAGPTGSGDGFLNSGKDPWEYTLEEFRALSDEEQVLFRNSFDSLDAFYAWVDQVQAAEVQYPWDKAGAKQPAEYTLEEFEALTMEEQLAFQNSFGSQEAFEDWLDQHTPLETMAAEPRPWEHGGKQPKDYTWAEFEALSAELQMAFQNSFGTLADFDAWLERNMPQETEPTVKLPWENGGKQPKDYTWAEFEALSAELQMAFQNSFASMEEFDAWLVKAQNAESSSNIPWENGGKQPKDYTWAEFEALSAELQMAFQNSFESFEAFDAWLKRVNP